MKLALLRLYAALGGPNHRRRLSEALRKAGETNHWYYITSDYCPVCNSDQTERQRIYGPRPRNFWDRHSVEESYDGCDY